MYSREDETGWKQSAAFKKAFSIDVDIQLLAVWWVVPNLCAIRNWMKGCMAMILQGHRGLRWRDPEAPSFYDL